MCLSEGMGLCPWGALGGGLFKTAAQREEIQKNGNPGRAVQPSETDLAVSRVLEGIATRKNTAMTSVALAYVMQKTPYVVPIVGGRKVEHLLGNIEALSLELADADVKEIESAYPFDLGFPMSFLFRGEKQEAHPANSQFLNTAARFDYVALPRAVPPKKVDDPSGQS